MERGKGRISRTTERTRPSFIVPAVCAFLLLAAALVFVQTVRQEFVNYDDDLYVYRNSHVLGGLNRAAVAWAATQRHVGNWHPLTWISHMVDCQVYGLWPGGHHLTNVVIHAATAILLFLFLRRVTERLWTSSLVAAIFCVHPLRAESVAWVAERKDVLAGLFFVLLLWAYFDFARQRFSFRRYLLVIGVYALGLMCKPMLVTAPFVLLLLDYWPLRRAGSKEQEVKSGDLKSQISILKLQTNPKRENSNSKTEACDMPPGTSWARLLLEKLPLLALSLASCAVTVWSQSTGILALKQAPLSTRLANAIVCGVGYLVQSILPMGLAPLYPYPQQGVPVWKCAAAATILVVISGACVKWRRQRPSLFVGWLWYLGMLVPVIGLVQVGYQSMADRYSYLPQIGIGLMLFSFLPGDVPSGRFSRGVLALAASAGVAVLAAVAWRQTAFWHDSGTLWRRTLEVTTENYCAHNNLGTAYQDQGRLGEAAEQFEEALRIRSDFAEAELNLHIIMAQQGRIEEALRGFRNELSPAVLAPIQYHCGVVLQRRGELTTASEYYRRAIAGDPEYKEAHNNLAACLAEMGRLPEAIVEWQRALKIDPELESARQNLARALAEQRQPEEVPRKRPEGLGPGNKSWD